MVSAFTDNWGAVAEIPRECRKAAIILLEREHSIMETTIEAGSAAADPTLPVIPPADVEAVLPPQLDAETKINSSVMSIRLTPDGLVIKDDQVVTDEGTQMLSGVYCDGIQYYDLKGVSYINNTGMAILIDVLKSLLEMGVEVQFVNVHENIRKKIHEMGLEHIINCG
jgi:anti-anti-sigma factor